MRNILDVYAHCSCNNILASVPIAPISVNQLHGLEDSTLTAVRWYDSPHLVICQTFGTSHIAARNLCFY